MSNIRVDAQAPPPSLPGGACCFLWSSPVGPLLAGRLGLAPLPPVWEAAAEKQGPTNDSVRPVVVLGP